MRSLRPEGSSTSTRHSPGVPHRAAGPPAEFELSLGWRRSAPVGRSFCQGMNLAIRSTAGAAVPRTQSRRIPPVGVFVPLRRATLRVARSSAVICGQSIRRHVRRPPRQPAATGLSESAPARGTATARVPVALSFPQPVAGCSICSISHRSSSTSSAESTASLPQPPLHARLPKAHHG